MDERGGHKDLHGSDCQSVISYVHGRTIVVLLKHALSEPAFLSALVKMRLSEPFIAHDSAGAHLSKEARFGAEGHMVASELTSARRRGSGPQDTWRLRSPPLQ
jgi:hypothetical protein